MHRNIKKSLQFGLVFFLASFLLSCQAYTGPQVLTPNQQMIKVELADTPEERQIGLMHRKDLAEDEGMLFVFEQAQPRSFWMKNTLIPLDILYLDANAVVIDIQTMVPCPEDEEQCPTYPSAAPAKYALEINAGDAEYLGLEVGDTLVIKF